MSDLRTYIESSDLHQTALRFLTHDYAEYSDLREPVKEATGYDHPFNIFTDLVEAGMVERRDTPLYGANKQPRGFRAAFKLA